MSGARAIALALALVLPAAAHAFDVHIDGPFAWEPFSTGGRFVACPDGAAGIGGGIEAENGDAMVAAVSRPDRFGFGSVVNSWNASMRNLGAQTQQWKLAVVCGDLPDLSLQEQEFGVAPNGIGGAVELCTAGRIALTGGLSKADPTNAADKSIAATAPYFPDYLLPRLVDRADGENLAPRGWEAAFVSEGPAGTGRVYAVCTSHEDVVTMVESGVIAAGANRSTTVVCPLGKEAVSGGFDAENRDGLRLVSSAPIFLGGFPFEAKRLFELSESPVSHPLGWRVVVRNDADAARAYKVAAVCVPEPRGALLGALAAFTLALVRRARAVA